MQRLTDRKIKSLKAKDKKYKISDGKGLFLLINPTGSKIWKFEPSYFGKRITLTFGEYPYLGLQAVREKHSQAIEDLQSNKDPRDRLKNDKEIRTFSYYAKERVLRDGLRESTLIKKLERIESYLSPVLDRKPVTEISSLDILHIVKPVADKGKVETASRLITYARQTFDDLLIMGVIANNPAEGLGRLLPKHKNKKNFPHLTDVEDFKNLLQAIPKYKGDWVVSQSLRLAPLLFLRPGNIRFLKWQYIDFKNRLITFPAEAMKMSREFKVPLAHQAVEILEGLRRVTGNEQFVFITGKARTKNGRLQPISESTLSNAIKRLINPITGCPFGTGVITPHGFRHTASTMLNEMNYNPDVIELQLAHLDRDRVRAVYNKAERIQERREMMQHWADYLDVLMNGNVVSLKKVDTA